MKESKTHYRKVFKSDHLGSADLEEMIEEGKELIFTIKVVKQEYGTKVAGRKVDANIAYFAENIKPMVLNATNSKVIKGFTGSSFVEDWANVRVQLYIDRDVKMKGEVVGGVRISNIKPIEKQKPHFTKDKFEVAKEKNATIEFIKKSWIVTPEIEKEYNEWIAS